MAFRREECTVKLSELRHPERNVRIHGKKQIDEMVRSLNFAEQLKPILIDENNVVLAGNGLMDGMLQRGDTEAWCVRIIGASENDKKKIMTMDNRLYALGSDNHDVIEEFIRELAAAGEAEIPGYDQAIIDTIAAETEQVTQMVQSFGVMTEDDKERIDKAAERKKAIEKGEVAPPYGAPAPVGAPAPGAHGAPDAPPAVRYDARTGECEALTPEDEAESDSVHFVVCPHCGMKIYYEP